MSCRPWTGPPHTQGPRLDVPSPHRSTCSPQGRPGGRPASAAARGRTAARSAPSPGREAGRRGATGGAGAAPGAGPAPGPPLHQCVPQRFDDEGRRLILKQEDKAAGDPCPRAPRPSLEKARGPHGEAPSALPGEGGARTEAAGTRPAPARGSEDARQAQVTAGRRAGAGGGPSAQQAGPRPTRAAAAGLGDSRAWHWGPRPQWYMDLHRRPSRNPDAQAPGRCMRCSETAHQGHP